MYRFPLKQFLKLLVFAALAPNLAGCVSSSGEEKLSTANKTEQTRQIQKRDIETCPVNRWQLDRILRDRIEDPSKDGLVSGLAFGEVGMLLNEVVRDGSASSKAEEYAENARRYFEERDLTVRVVAGSPAW